MSEKMADKIQKLLALAEAEAKAGNEAARDTLLEKAAALQLKYAIEDAMLFKQHGVTVDQIIFADFCRESNTPLIKAKRQLINEVAYLNRGKAVMMPEWQDCKPSKRHPNGRKFNQRAFIRVYAHESDLTFISQLYTSLILQMQTAMASEEKQAEAAYGTKITNAWRVSFAYGYVGRVATRMHQAKRRNEAAEETSTPGTALVLADRQALVTSHIQGLLGKLKKSKVRHDDNDYEGRRAGALAGNRADVGGTKVSGSTTRQLDA